MRNTQKGFTLIELLVVIAIIGLLSTLAVVALNSAREKSRDSKRVADVKQIQTALELYFADSSDGYPDVDSASPLILGETGAQRLCSTTAWETDPCGSETTYMGLVPSAPTPEDGDCTEAENAYSYSGGDSAYEISFCIGGTVGDLAGGVVLASQDGMAMAPVTP